MENKVTFKRGDIVMQKSWSYDYKMPITIGTKTVKGVYSTKMTIESVYGNLISCVYTDKYGNKCRSNLFDKDLIHSRIIEG